MPNRAHEIPLRVIQNQPALAPVLLRQALGYEVPRHTEAILTSSVLTNCDPKEWNSDGAIVLREGTTPVLAVVVERQQGLDEGKHYSWPAYLATLYGRLKCPAVLIVLCPDAAKARWCSQPIPLGHPGFTLTPMVIGPDNTPVVTDPEQAQALPELAVLSAYAHGNTEPKTLEAVVAALEATAPEHRTFYYDYVLSGLNEAARKELEGMMAVHTYEWQSDFARKYVSIGREEGREEGRTKEASRSVLLVLESVGATITDTARARIEGCTDLDTLEGWLRRAPKATSAEELFG